MAYGNFTKLDFDMGPDLVFENAALLFRPSFALLFASDNVDNDFGMKYAPGPSYTSWSLVKDSAFGPSVMARSAHMNVCGGKIHLMYLRRDACGFCGPQVVDVVHRMLPDDGIMPTSFSNFTAATEVLRYTDPNTGTFDQLFSLPQGLCLGDEVLVQPVVEQFVDGRSKLVIYRYNVTENSWTRGTTVFDATAAQSMETAVVASTGTWLLLMPKFRTQVDDIVFYANTRNFDFWSPPYDARMTRPGGVDTQWSFDDVSCNSTTCVATYRFYNSTTNASGYLGLLVMRTLAIPSTCGTNGFSSGGDECSFGVVGCSAQCKCTAGYYFNYTTVFGGCVASAPSSVVSPSVVGSSEPISPPLSAPVVSPTAVPKSPSATSPSSVPSSAPTSLVPVTAVPAGAPATTETIPGLRATFYSDANLNDEAFKRIDAVVDFAWGETESPGSGIQPGNPFSVRWVGFIKPVSVKKRAIVTKTMWISCNDGVRLTVNGIVAINAWEVRAAPQVVSGIVELQTDSPNSLLLEFFSAGGAANVSLRWADAGSTEWTVVPGLSLTTTAQAAPTAAVVPDSNTGKIVAGVLVPCFVIAVVIIVVIVILRRRKQKRAAASFPSADKHEEMAVLPAQTPYGEVPEESKESDSSESSSNKRKKPGKSVYEGLKPEWIIEKEDLVIGRKIGQGAFGTVKGNTMMQTVLSSSAQRRRAEAHWRSSQLRPN
jgi:hypothetical protein